MNNLLFIQPPLFYSSEHNSIYPSITILTNELILKGANIEVININDLFLSKVKEKFLKAISNFNPDKLQDFEKQDCTINERMKNEINRFICSFFCNYKNDINKVNDELYLYKRYNITKLFNKLWSQYIEKLITNYSNNKQIEEFENTHFYNLLNESMNKIVNLNKYQIIAFTVPLEENLFYTLLLCKMLRDKNFKGKVVIGGAYFSVINDKLLNEILKNSTYDHLVKGCGVNTLKNLLNGNELTHYIYEEENIPFNNLLTKKTINMITNDKERNKRFSIIHSKGCYWKKCAYCNYRKLYNKNKIIIRDINSVLSDIISLYNKGITSFYFICEALDQKSANLISNFIINNKIKCNWKCFLRCDNWKLSTLELLKKSGGSDFVLGLETVNDRLLKLINKGTNKETIKKLFDKIEILNLKVEVNIIPDLPSSTKKEIIETLEFIKKYKNYISRLNVSRFRVLNASDIAENPEKFGIKLLPNYEDKSNQIPFERITGLKGGELDDLCNKFDKLSESIYLPQLQSKTNNYNLKTTYSLKTDINLWNLNPYKKRTAKINYDFENNFLFLSED